MNFGKEILNIYHGNGKRMFTDYVISNSKNKKFFESK